MKLHSLSGLTPRVCDPPEIAEELASCSRAPKHACRLEKVRICGAAGTRPGPLGAKAP